MKQSSERILTTHVGSLPRPPDLLAMIQAKEQGAAVDTDAFAARVKSAVAEVVKKQADSRHRHRRRRRDGAVRLYPLCQRAPCRDRAAQKCEPRRRLGELARIPGFSRILPMGGADAGYGGAGAADAMGVHRAGLIPRARRAAARHRQSEGRPCRCQRTRKPSCRRCRRPISPIGTATNIIKTDEEFRVALADALARGIPGDRRCRADPADRRPAAGEPLGDASRNRPRAMPQMGERQRRVAEPRASRHPGRAGALSHLLQHQHGAARP